MYQLLTAARREQMLVLAQHDPYYQAVLDNVKRKALAIAARPGMYHADDTQNWWSCLSRIEDVALAEAIYPHTQGLAAWLIGAVDEVLAQPADMWIGPFFRGRTQPPQGQLETAEIVIALTRALLLCPDAFAASRREAVLQAVREIGMPYIKAWLACYTTPDKPQHNWSIALLHGFVCASVLLDEKENMVQAAALYTRLLGTINSNFYGEMVSYWGYAASGFASIRMLVEAVWPDVVFPSAMTYARIMPWAAAHYVGEFSPECTTIPMPRFINYSDDDAMFRPFDAAFADAACCEEEMPKLAALASACIRRWYTPENLTPPSQGSLGFWNDMSLWTVVRYPDFAAPARSITGPAVQRFHDGFTLIRKTDETGTLLLSVLSGGDEIPKVVSHRHADENGLFAAYNQVVLLDDPGRCCYRLPLQRKGAQSSEHSLPFFSVNDEALPQRLMGHDDANQPPRNADAGHQLGEDWFYACGSSGELYPEPLTQVERCVLALGAHMALVEDSWRANTPVDAGVRFVGNNRRMLMRWSMGEAEVHLSREGVGVRILSLDGIKPALGYGTLHDCGHVNPASMLQGREGSAYHLCFASEQAKSSGLLRSLLIFDTEDRLMQWHVTTSESETTVYTPEGTVYARVEGVPAKRVLWHGQQIDPLGSH